VRGFRAAVLFLTRFPLGAGPMEASDIPQSVPWFPVVGGLLGAALAGVYAVARLFLPPFVAATVAVGVGIFATGAFHEDGLADSADALGGRSREEALGILKDPAHGTYGVLAIALSVVLRAGALSALSSWTALAALPAAHALSRGASIGSLGTVRVATADGLGSSFAGALTRVRVAVSISAALIIGFAAMGIWAIPSAAIAALGTWSIGRLALHKFGGVTGDIAGAVQQIAETLVLVFAAAVVTRGWPSLAWWR